LFLVVSSSAIDCLERLVSDMTYYVLSGTLNPTHSHSLRFCWRPECCTNYMLYYCIVQLFSAVTICVWSLQSQT